MRILKKVLRHTLAVLALLLLIVVIYFFMPYVINLFARPYNQRTYASRLEEKSKRKSTTYYFSPNGSDANIGTSKTSAWKSVQKINEIELNPGDSILLEGGQVFKGNIEFDEHDLGTASKPVFVGSYGSGKATIDAANGDAINGKNCAGFHISNLVVKGNGAETNKGSGIAFINDLHGEIKLEFLQIDFIESYGFGYWGILVDGNRKKSGYTNVVIAYSKAHHNGDAGVYVYGEFNFFSKQYAHQKVTIHHVEAYNNEGRTDTNKNTGSGIVLSDIDGGVVEHCSTHHNGSKCTSDKGGPVGVWVWDARRVTIQYNESYENKTAGRLDGGGFDLDGGTKNSVLQYNYSHDNDGAGYFLAQFANARKHTGNIIRYNISINDGRKNNYSGIYVWGNAENAAIYNNTVFVSAVKGSTPHAICIQPNDVPGFINSPDPRNIFLANNSFVTTDGAVILNVMSDKLQLKFLNNNYYSLQGSPAFLWGATSFSSLDSWRKATAQETEGGKNFGFSLPPAFPKQPPVVQIASVASSLLQEPSAFVDKGIDVNKKLPLSNMAVKDFAGKKIPQGKGYDLGAFESVSKP